ncbi:PREDICTED: lipase maturation factor 2 [Lepidothrix coronata]|uniref:Lipase maturation factor n=1 Tax=Lepidothrix coronata TaxID=321398 RepID=A0A6J0J614_9PASS|nr:PREDICTED: lipase maturation factor 2 [Lepidothrix coronata]
MAEAARPRALFLAGLAAVYVAAFGSLYVQIPGLYGREGILPARKVLRLSGKGLWEQLRDSPTLLWLSPRLGLDTEQGMELLCLVGILASFGALLCESMRDCLVFALLRVLYLSLYQVGQVFLYFQWWVCGGLTALTYHYETQCIPTPGAWLAHQLPVWFQKLSVVATYVIEVAVPVLFFAPLRRLRLFAFYCQVLLQVLIILTGNYNFFNALTIVLAFSLLDEEHVGRWLGRPKKRQGSAWPPSLGSVLATLLELNTYGLLLYWTVQYFGLEINWDKKLLDSKVAFTYHEFTTWLRTVTLPLVGVAFLSLSWEILLAMYRCACVRGCFWKLWATLQWAIMATATVSLFAVSLVPFTYIEHESNGKLWPGIHRLFGAVERFQVVNSYGLFRRMTGVGGRPEVVLEGSYDGHSWTDKPPPRRRSDAALPWLLGWVRGLARPFSGPAVLWTLYLVAATVGVLRALGPRARGGPPPARHKARGERGERNGVRGEGRGRAGGEGHGEGRPGPKKKK